MRVCLSLILIGVPWFFLPRVALAVYSIEVNNMPGTVDVTSGEEISLELVVELGRDADYYLRGAFSSPGTSSYFGCTNGYCGTNPPDFYRVHTDGDGKWSGVLVVKPDKDSPHFAGSGEYDFKIGYYTAAGSGPNWRYEGPVYLAYQSPSPTPTNTLSPTPIFTSTPTPIPTSTPSSSPTPTRVSSYDNVYLTEFLPDPESGNEKVEIKNGNSYTVSLTNWQIDDVQGGGHAPKVFSAEISASGLYVIDLGSSFFLNNDSDTVRLLDAGGNEKDKKDYSNQVKNRSYAKDSNGVWCWQQPSFGGDNESCPLAPSAVPTQTLTPTSTPSITLSPTPTQVPSPTPSKDPEIEVDLFGEEATSSVLGWSAGTIVPLSSNDKDRVSRPSKARLVIPVVVIGSGVGLVGFSLFFFFRHQQSL